MDLHITITDENGDQLRSVNIWMDGSDAEGADEIADWILLEYDGAREEIRAGA